MCNCLFAREHNISGNKKSSDHAKPRQNRGVQFSYYKHQSLPRATGTIFRGKQRSRRFCRVTQTKSNPNFCYWRQGLRCSFWSLLTHSSFWENVCTVHHYSNESFCTEETGYHWKILIPQFIVHNAKARVSQHPLLTWNIWLQLYLPVRHSPEWSFTWSFGLWSSQ